MGIFTDLIYIEKRQKEADNTGSKFVRAIDKDDGEFILKCGHSKIVSFRHMKGGGFSCVPCKENAIKQEALDKGVICLDENPDGRYNNYMFPSCGHIQRMARHNLLTKAGQAECSICFENELDVGASRNNLTIIERKVKTADRLCRFNCCGAEKKVSLHSLRNTVRCPACYRENINLRAESESGLKIDRSKKEYINNHRYFILPCGHEKHMSTQNAVSGRYVCRECEKSKLDLPSHLYLIRIEAMGYEWLKFGYGFSIKRRIKEYGLVDNSTTEVICDIPVETGEQARDYEKAIHTKYKSNKLNKKLMRNYMRVGGFSECYPISLLETLVDELNNCPFK